MSDLLHRRVEATAAERPDALAVALGGARLTYGELDGKSSRIANALVDLGCRPGDRICLFVGKSPLAVAAMLGSLKAGCLYVPIDLASPPARLAKIVAAADPSAVLLGAGAAGRLEGVVDSLGGVHGMTVVALEEGVSNERFDVAVTAAGLVSYASTSPAVEVAPEDGAHILFTSGSTGVPKGVVISHRNVSAFLDWAVPYFGIDQSDRMSGHAPFHFDLSTFDVYGALSAGAELHLVAPEQSLMPRDLAALIDHERLTQWFSVPSVMSYMASFGSVPDGGFASLRRVIWCGDVLPTPVLIHWMQRVRGPTYTNLYGPTEATIASSFHTVEAPPADETASIPIGAACGGEELLVLDEQQRPVARGGTGDLFIGGAGLSPGYWRDEEKTADAFVPDPRPSENGRRIYRTGDRARLGLDGLVYFLGRQDSQIKNRGHRIELGEVEAAVNALADVREAAVVGVATGGFEGTAVCCAFASEAERPVTQADVRSALRDSLPPYMVPTRWLVLPTLPTNANGKIDRRRLRELFIEAEAPSEARRAEIPR
jgi:amino acid adenylation domain-containing protein